MREIHLTQEMLTDREGGLSTVSVSLPFSGSILSRNLLCAEAAHAPLGAVERKEAPQCCLCISVSRWLFVQAQTCDTHGTGECCVGGTLRQGFCQPEVQL